MGYGPHWDLQPEESKEYGEALEACLATLPASKLATFNKLVTKWLPWVSLATVGINVTYPRIQETRAAIARHNEEMRRRAAIERGDIREFSRTIRADEGAPIADVHSPNGTVPVTESLVEETRAVDPFSEGEAPDTGGRSSDGNGSGNASGLFG